MDESASAAATAELVVDLYTEGQMPAVTADAALEDAVSAADAAVHSLTTIVVPDAEALAVQDSALIAAQSTARAVVATRVWVGDGSPRASEAVVAALEDSASSLETVTEQVGSLLEGGAS
ncbi:hypothetical protein ACFWGN_21125 [Oerskovia sp. NPDC060338]|uniref:hypothetical protein n=1 Tax=Oerskovia sp. NPDC060338 TaxID=3347100 RepID=UPI0036583673